MKRIKRGPVRGISLKLQEEERERRMDYVPDESALNINAVEVDAITHDMLKAMNLAQTLAVVSVAQAGASKPANFEGRPNRREK
jgi:small subunit ribosomal protein S17e